MRLRRLLIACAIAAAALAAAPLASAACALEGDGSAAHPFLVRSKSTLALVGHGDCVLTANYRQTADITWTGDFTPIGDDGGGFSRFEGTYDGGGHAIIGLHIVRSANREAMFANVDDATIENLELRDLTVDGDGLFVGGLVAYGSADAGPIIVRDVRITGASSISSTLDSDSAGALFGYVADNYADGPPLIDNRLTISDVSSTADVHGVNDIGGLIGVTDLYSPSTSIRRVSSTGDVTADGIVAGGLIGYLTATRMGIVLADSYARGDVTAAVSWAGGLIGKWLPVAGVSDSVLRTYATGRVSSPGANAGGLFGEALTPSEPALDSLYDVTTTGQNDLSDNAKTTAQMKDIATYRDAGWGILQGWLTPSDLTVWGICPLVNDGYPFLLSAYDAPGPCARETIGMKVVRTFVGRGGLAHAPAPRTALQSNVSVRWRRPSDAPIGTTYTVTWRVNGVDRVVAVGTRTSARLRVGNTGEVDVSIESSHGNRSARLLLPANVFRRPVYAACTGPWQALCGKVGTRYRMGKVRQVATFVRSGTRSASVICRGAAPAKAGATRTVCRLSTVGKALLRRGPIVVRMTTTLVIGPITFADSALVAIPKIAGS